jgi:NaMN:DMB phosphoribosyltransferase
LDNVVIGTTRWIVEDGNADLAGILAQIADVPVLAARLDFRRSKFGGLRAYEAGAVKEGVGAGGAAISAILKTGGTITCDALLAQMEEDYEKLVSRRSGAGK